MSLCYKLCHHELLFCTLYMRVEHAVLGGYYAI